MKTKVLNLDNKSAGDVELTTPSSVWSRVRI